MQKIDECVRTSVIAACYAAASLIANPSSVAAELCVGEPSMPLAMEGSLNELIAGGEALIASGLEAQGLARLHAAAKLAEQDGKSEEKAFALGAYGHGLMLVGENVRALACLEASLNLASAHNMKDLEALAHLNKGTLYTTMKERPAAASLALAIEKSQVAERPDIAARALINRASFFIYVVKNQDDALEDLIQASTIIDGLSDKAERASLLLALGAVASGDLPIEAENGLYNRLAYEKLSETLNLAKDEGLPALISSALGQLSKLYAHQERFDEALRLLDQAIVEARQEDVSSLVYRWYWERAKLRDRVGDQGAALNDYELAVDTVNDLRAKAALNDSVLGRSPLKDAQDLFAEYIDLLFGDDGEVLSQADLERIQDVVEQQRQVEVESYFRDDCVADLQSRISKIRELELPEVGVAYLYPIFSKERLILLTSIAGQLAVTIRDIREEDLKRDVKLARRSLEVSESTASEYLPLMQKLYRNLIEPIAPALKSAEIDTLVIVPSGPLRGVPFAALYDGTDYLIRQYAIAITPGLSLLEPNRLSSTPFKALVGGLTERVENFPFLEFAEEEVDAIIDLHGGTALKGQDFAVGRLQQSIAEIPYSVVHIASHAEIRGRQEKTFIVTQDGRIDLDQLEGLIRPSAFRDRPIELLTLSACKTATGEDLEQAGLGLAGIAVKAGARSVLGTLWPVFDVSSPELMKAFYRNIGPAGLTKAKALQQAQVEMLDSGTFDHPAFWAPYLLIGNWL